MGERLEFVAEADPGDFIYVPPYVPHQEINASDELPLSCVLVRSGKEPVVVNLDLPNVERNPESVQWVDDFIRPGEHDVGRNPQKGLSRTSPLRPPRSAAPRGESVSHRLITGWTMRACQPARSSSGVRFSCCGQPTQR
jgi:hypothetical protein